MPDYDHLRLPFIPEETPRKKIPRGGRLASRNDKARFLKEEMDEIDKIQKDFKEEKKNYPKYIDPNLIFKIDITQRVDENTFRTEFRRMGIEVIAASPDKSGYWILNTDNEEFTDFTSKLEKYFAENRYKFFDAIGKPSSIPPAEKKGRLLQGNPFLEEEVSYLDIEIWRMDNGKLMKFITGFRRLIEELGGEISDELTTKNFSLFRIKCNKRLYDSILTLREVAFVDRPPKTLMRLETSLEKGLDKVEPVLKPKKDAAGILIVDSGVLSGHPLLGNAIGDEISLATKYSARILEDGPSDDVGHGTEVAGISLYGDLDECISSEKFEPQIWIFSAKVMFRGEGGDAEYDDRELVEHQLKKSIEWIAENYPNCRVVNLSLGNTENRLVDGIRQFNLASLIDELAKEYNLIFIVSAGNIEDYTLYELSDDYPNYLFNNTEKIRIIDPASSALALTIGAICKNRLASLDCMWEYYPSMITRVGPGYNGMIKPELVENGGKGFGKESDVITINPNWFRDGRLFTLVSGTSISAPKVAHYIAMLINLNPNRSNNLIKALLISSASTPLSTVINEKDPRDYLNLYGYGVPDIKRAAYSNENQVMLKEENKIHLNRFHIYSFYLPREFVDISGEKSISVTLVFDPEVRKNRSDYLGVTMEAHLFKNIDDINYIKNKYGYLDINKAPDEIVPEDIKRNEIKLSPGVNTRKRGTHQKGIKLFSKRPDIDIKCPLYLVVVCQNRWIKNEDNEDDENYIQDYAVVVSLEHAAQIDLYNQIRIRNRERIELSLNT